ncbi:MAG: hypothetical protein ACLFNM_03655 [Candidatus Woesearchaeota archaeon]
MSVLLYANKDHFNVFDALVGFSDTTRYFYTALKENKIPCQVCFEPDVSKAKNHSIILPRFEVPTPGDVLAQKNYLSFLSDLADIEQSSKGKKLFWNSPKTMLENFNKEYLLELSDVVDETIFATSVDDVLNFLSYQNDKYTILKPTNGSKGVGVEQIRKDFPGVELFVRNYFSLYADDKGRIIVQDFNSDIAKYGDTRLNVVDGQLISAMTRTPAHGSVKANIHAGASATKYELQQKDFDLIQTIQPFLKEKNIYLAGVDVCKETLIEVNLLSPGGVVRSDYFNGNTKTKDFFVDRIRSYLKNL